MRKRKTEHKTTVIGSTTDRIPADRLTAPPNERYHTKHVIGSGGMKIVVRSEDVNVGRDIAMAISKDSSERKQLQFLEEAHITAVLEHPNIVPVHDIGRSKSGVPFFTMKLIHGVTLAKILEKLQEKDPDYQKRYPLHARLEIFLKVCDAIAFAHSKGILHLDIKPDNIQVGEYGEVLVLDWGIARRIGEPENDADSEKKETKKPVGATLDGIIRGTPEYMSPEQAAGKNSRRSRQTDIYALGAILYTILTLHPPFRGESMEEILRNVLTGNIIPPRLENGSRIPLPLEFIILRAMSRDPERRYESVGALKDDVVAYQSGFATVAENAGISTRFLLWLKRNRIRIYVISSILLTIAIILLFLALHIYTVMLSERVYGRSEQARIAAEKAFTGLESRIRRENYREWKLKYEDSFFDTYILDRWKFLLNHQHELSQNQAERYIKKTGKGLRVFARPVPIGMFFRERITSPDLRMLTELRIVDSAPGAVILMTLNNTGFGDGYVFALLPRRNSYVSLHRGHNEETLAEARVENPPPGESWKIDVILTTESNGTTLKMSVQGKEVLHYTDPRRTGAIPGRASACAFSFQKCTLDLQSVKIMTLGTSIKADILDIAERQLRKGNFAAAYELFQEAEESASTPRRRQKAADGLRTAKLFSEYRSRIPSWETQLRNTWKGARIRLNLEDGGFHLSASGESVRDLSVLRDIPISSLTLTSAAPQDFTPIRTMKLTRLHLRECHIPDPAPLASLPLTDLVFSGIPLKNIDFLKGMNLKNLTLHNCGLTSLAPLRGMKLEHLDIRRNRIDDLKSLRGIPLKTLHASFNRIHSVLPLLGMPLTKVNLSCNLIDDLLPLHGLPITDLNLSSNRIADLSVLRGMPLRMLNVENNKIETLQPLEDTTGLETLYASNNRITDLHPLKRMTKLTRLSIGNNRVFDLKALEGCRELVHLNAPSNQIRDLEPLRELTRLETLNCAENPIHELDPLNALNLSTLIVSGSRITSFGTAFLKPPTELFIFQDEEMSPEQLQRLISRIVPGNATEFLLRRLRVLENFRQEKKTELRSMAQEINGKYYTLIPVLMDYESARRAAVAFGARLPSWNSSREQMELFRVLKVPFWIGLVPKDGKLYWEDGRIFASRTDYLPQGMSGCFLDRDRSRGGIVVNLNPGQKLPLVLEWK